MTDPNMTSSPRSIAVAAAYRLEAMIALNKHDPLLQQAMRIASLVVLRSGMLAPHQAGHDAHKSYVKHTSGTSILH